MTLNFQDLISPNSRNRLLSAVTTLVAVIILVTPLCGMIFACGCTWPGLGLDSFCNIHDIHAQHQCPWCVSPLIAWLAVGSSALAGILASLLMKSHSGKGTEAVRRISAGVSAFALAALIGGIISASLQHYPLPFQ